MSPAMEALALEMAEAAFAALSPKVRALFEELAKKPNDPLLTVTEAATRLGISEASVRRLEKKGFLKPVPGLPTLHFRQSTVDAYGKSNTTQEAGK